MESNDILSKKYRQSLPRNNEMPLIISESGQLVDPDGGLLPYQGNIGRHADNIFDPDAYIYPEGFEKMRVSHLLQTGISRQTGCVCVCVPLCRRLHCLISMPALRHVSATVPLGTSGVLLKPRKPAIQ